MKFKTLLLAGMTLGAMTFANVASAGGYDNSADYNSPMGMSSSAQMNAPVSSSLRDANGNLTVVNGQITSSSFSEVGGAQNYTASSGGVGTSTMTGTATAVGNQLNVVTAGSNNIVIVSSTQTNNGNQTANTNLDGH